MASVDESPSRVRVRRSCEKWRRPQCGDRRTRVISDWLVIRVTALAGESFLTDISMVEGATRQKTPNEIALTILLSALTLIFLLVVATSCLFDVCGRFPVKDNRSA